ncbi:hypothetical protein CLV40_108118 [Actinokineospora auranticolor]|uniref:Uncharacterized protein n=1 Tax=Actinokineospora auranticolor TaxID=155976 RepID=A0A2S6GPR7_9PSEU|nr:hypothetical protein CLV40_108118 [Actinokineospora auranticolor]
MGLETFEHKHQICQPKHHTHDRAQAPTAGGHRGSANRSTKRTSSNRATTRSALRRNHADTGSGTPGPSRIALRPRPAGHSRRPGGASGPTQRGRTRVRPPPPAAEWTEPGGRLDHRIPFPLRQFVPHRTWPRGRATVSGSDSRARKSPNAAAGRRGTRASAARPPPRATRSASRTPTPARPAPQHQGGPGQRIGQVGPCSTNHRESPVTVRPSQPARIRPSPFHQHFDGRQSEAKGLGTKRFLPIAPWR